MYCASAQIFMTEQTTTTTKTYEDMIADLINRFMWVFFTCTSVGLVILVEIIFLNKSCSL